MEVKLEEFKEAVENFSYLVNLDLKSLNLDKRLIDAIENGMIQKFEYSIEICWKLIKKFLKQEDGIDAKTPKQSIKEFYLAGYIDEDNYFLHNVSLGYKGEMGAEFIRQVSSEMEYIAKMAMKT